MDGDMRTAHRTAPSCCRCTCKAARQAQGLACSIRPRQSPRNPPRHCIQLRYPSAPWCRCRCRCGVQCLFPAQKPCSRSSIRCSPASPRRTRRMSMTYASPPRHPCSGNGMNPVSRMSACRCSSCMFLQGRCSSRVDCESLATALYSSCFVSLQPAENT